MVKIKYNGPIGNHMVTSPMRRVGTYGLHTRGDIFDVHEVDQKAKPEVFVRYPEAEKRGEIQEIMVTPEIVTPETPLVSPAAPATPVVEEQVEKPKPAKKKARSKK